MKKIVEKEKDNFFFGISAFFFLLHLHQKISKRDKENSHKNKKITDITFL